MAMPGESMMRPGRGRPVSGRGARAVLALALLVPHLTGCYREVPANPSLLPSGAEVSLGVTDAGRVALVEEVGPGVRRLEGRVLEATDSTLVVALSRVRLIDLEIPMQRDGERVEIRREHVTDLRERQLARSRTWLAAGIAAAVVVSLFFIAITGFGGDDPVERPDPGNGDDT